MLINELTMSPTTPRRMRPHNVVPVSIYEGLRCRVTPTNLSSDGRIWFQFSALENKPVATEQAVALDSIPDVLLCVADLMEEAAKAGDLAKAEATWP